MEQERERGTVVMFKTRSGYGFIEPINLSQDIYFHASDWPASESIELGKRVTYTRSDRNGRPIARQIIPVQD